MYGPNRVSLIERQAATFELYRGVGEHGSFHFLCEFSRYPSKCSVPAAAARIQKRCVEEVVASGLLRMTCMSPLLLELRLQSES